MNDNNEKILVSIIVPIYNLEDYLDKCIQSLIKQTHKNLEIFLVDDGSTDKSSKVCDDWQKKDSRIIVIHKENGGVSSARNAGLKKRKGEYAASVDPDDYVKENYVEILLNSAVNNNCEMSIVNLIEVFSNGHENKYTFSTPNKLLNRHDFLENLYNKRTYKSGPCNKLYLKKVIDENNIYFREDVHYGEDLFFIVKFAEKSERFYYEFDENLYYYYYRNGSPTKCGFNEKTATLLNVCDELIDIYEKNNVDSCAIKNKYIVFYYFSLYFFNQNNNYSKQEYKRIYKKYFYDVFKAKKITIIEKLTLIGVVVFPRTMKILKNIKMLIRRKKYENN